MFLLRFIERSQIVHLKINVDKTKALGQNQTVGKDTQISHIWGSK